MPKWYSILRNVHLCTARVGGESRKKDDRLDAQTLARLGPDRSGVAVSGEAPQACRSKPGVMKRRNGFLSAPPVSRREVCIEKICPDQHADQRHASNQKAEER